MTWIPRQFNVFVFGQELYADTLDGPSLLEGDNVKVIEREAYDAVVKELDEAKAKLKLVLPYFCKQTI